MRAQMHDGTILEFPDDTDFAVVQATVKRMLSRQSAGQIPVDSNLRGPARTEPSPIVNPSLTDRLTGALQAGRNVLGNILASPITMPAALMGEITGHKDWGGRASRALVDEPSSPLGQEYAREAGKTMAEYGPSFLALNGMRPAIKPALQALIDADGPQSLPKSIGPGVGTNVAAVFSDNAARAAAARQTAQAAGGEAALPGLYKSLISQTNTEVPLSASAVTRNPNIAILEQRARLKNSPAWSEFDQTQARSIWEQVQSATSEATTLGDRMRARADNWAKHWEAAAKSVEAPLTPSKLVNVKTWADKVGKFADNLEQASISPEASNPQVQAALRYVAGEMDRVGDTFSPSHLQVMRAELNGKVPFNPPNALKAAPRESPAIISLIKEMDGILNATTGGKWDVVKQGYTADSRSVREAKAAGLVRESFIDPQTGMLRKTAAAPDVPTVTQSGLKTAIDKARLPDKSLALSDDAYKGLQSTLDAIIAQDFVRSVKKSATAGGGSDTASNFLALGNGRSGLLGRAVSLAGDVATGRKEAAMSRLLMDPDALRMELEAQYGGLLSNQTPMPLGRYRW